MDDKYLSEQLNRIIVFALEHQEWRNGALAILREVYERGRKRGWLDVAEQVEKENSNTNSLLPKWSRP